MTGIEKTCACGKTFITNRSNQIHCSRRCNNQRNHNSPIWNDKQRNYKYKINYGISLEEYNGMFLQQEGKCKICKTHQSEFKKSLHVDHNHETGEVRGLLCHNCNLALGRFQEDPAILAAALEYVS